MPKVRSFVRVCFVAESIRYDTATRPAVVDVAFLSRGKERGGDVTVLYGDDEVVVEREV